MAATAESVRTEGSIIIPFSMEGARQDKDHEERYEVKEFPKDGPVIYRKWVSNASTTDFIPSKDHPWVEEYVDQPHPVREMDPRVYVSDGGEEEPVGLQHGLIMVYHGRPHRTVGILQSGEILNEDEAALREEVNGRAIERFTEFCFRLVKVIKTDGPVLTERRKETNEQQRNRAEERMFNKQQEFFAQLMSELRGGIKGEAKSIHNEPESPAAMLAKIREMPKEQRENVMSFLLAETEEGGGKNKKK